MSSTPNATQLQAMLTKEIYTWKNHVDLNSLLQIMRMQRVVWDAVSMEYEKIKKSTCYLTEEVKVQLNEVTVLRLKDQLDETQQEYYSVCCKLSNVPDPAILLTHCKDVIESQSLQILQLSSTNESLNAELQQSEKLTVEFKSKAFSEMVNVTDPTTLFTHCKDIIDSSNQQKLQLLSTVELLNRELQQAEKVTVEYKSRAFSDMVTDPTSLFTHCKDIIDSSNQKELQLLSTVELLNRELQESEKLIEEYKFQNQELTVAGTALSNEEREELINLRKEAALSNEEREELINLRKESAEYEVITSNH